MAAVSENLLNKVKQSLLERLRSNGGSITEHDLSNRFGVSRGDIREALSQLDQQGLIERRRKSGTTLRRPTLKELIDLWDVRCGIEGMAARLACASITESDLKMLRDLCDRRAQAARANDEAQVNDTDIQFHEHIIAVSGNLVIRDMVRKTHLFDRIFKIVYPVPCYWPDDEALPYGHLKIVDALAQRDANQAEHLMKRHIQAGKKRRIEALIGKLDMFEDSDVNA